MSRLLGILLALAVLALIVGSYTEAKTEAEHELRFYCEMVDIRRNSGDPNVGWPDYKGVYDEQCN